MWHAPKFRFSCERDPLRVSGYVLAMPLPEQEIDASKIKIGRSFSRAFLHITGGARAAEVKGRLWRWFPIMAGGQEGQLSERPIDHVEDLARTVGLTVFGGDQHSDTDKRLPSRIWTPLEVPRAPGLQPADLWRAIGHNAEADGDSAYATFAHHIGHSLHAAGIRLRDASDHYLAQLQGAIDEKSRAGRRFSNIPMLDLQVAFHSVFSELASARDYLAASLAHKLGAPGRIDAMNKLADWAGAVSRAELATRPVVAEMLAAYDREGADPWLFQLGEYRNTFLHRAPFGAANGAAWLVYDEVDHNGMTFPRISLPLGDSDPFTPGTDALTRFIGLYRAMTRLAGLAVQHSPHEASLPSFVGR